MVPVAKFFVDQGLSVVGIDISSEMLSLARKNVPEAEFYQYDMSELDFPNESFHGITAVYSIFHVPKEKHQAIYENVFRMLRTGGIFFFCVGHEGRDGVSDFLGTKMFWSNYKPEKTLSLVKEAGFEIIFEDILDRGDELQYWVFAKKS